MIVFRWNRIIWVTFCRGILPRDGRLLVLLACRMFDFYNSRKIIVVGIIDLWYRLIPFLINRFKFKPEWTIGKTAKLIVIKFVNGSRVDDYFERKEVQNLSVVGFLKQTDIGMSDYFLIISDGLVKSQQHPSTVRQAHGSGWIPRSAG